MKIVRPWIFLTLYLIALGRPLAPILDYQVNRDFFAEVLCINKSKPELKCNGQCALSQKLKQAYNDESLPVSAPGIIKLDDYPIGFVAFCTSPSTLANPSSLRYSDTIIELVTQGYLFEVLRPPCTA